MSQTATKINSNMRIGDVAKMLGTTTRTLRFYDEAGLIAPRRSPKGTRLYSEADVERFRAILLLGGLGMSIEQMRQLAMARSQSPSGNDSSHRVSVQLQQMKNMAEEQITQYRKLLAGVDVALGLVEKCFGCSKQPTLANCDTCPVGSALPSSEVLALIWDQR